MPPLLKIKKRCIVSRADRVREKVVSLGQGIVIRCVQPACAHKPDCIVRCRLNYQTYHIRVDGLCGERGSADGGSQSVAEVVRISLSAAQADSGGISIRGHSPPCRYVGNATSSHLAYVPDAQIEGDTRDVRSGVTDMDAHDLGVGRTHDRHSSVRVAGCD